MQLCCREVIEPNFEPLQKTWKKKLSNLPWGKHMWTAHGLGNGIKDINRAFTVFMSWFMETREYLNTCLLAGICFTFIVFKRES